ncbi:MAG TPA: N-acetyltransferase [Candidatus Saccharimonadia bacterium]|jgi:putative acetyltransferase|nr:N-acetyltransferase [Candidatus Saccharimonadia bacterium]
MNLRVRPETPADFNAVDAVITRAFNRPPVAEMVRLIRASDNYVPSLALVAERDGRVVGHVMLSYAALESDTGEHQKVLTLSPVSVEPDLQKQGIGSHMIREVIRRADEQGAPMIVLEGHPEYYPKFGFKPAAELGVTFKLPDWAPPEAAMALPLSHYDPATAPKGRVVYPEAFAVAEE